MKNSYIFLQLFGSVYCGERLMNAYGFDIYHVVSLMCIHLILYLISVVIAQTPKKEIILGIDLAYLTIVLLAGNYEIYMLLFLVALEFLNLECHAVKKASVVGLTTLMGVIFLFTIKDNWFIYSVFLIIGIFIYFNEERLTQLTDTRDTLIEQVSSLNKSLEVLKQEKKQTTYITQITERNKLAQQLHDKVGHLLAGNVMQLEAVKIILPVDEAKGMACIDQIADSLRAGMEEIRYTLKELKPASSESGLSQVKGLLQDFKERTGITPKLVYKGDLESIDLERWHVIGENLKETMTNFIKYSKADIFEVSIEVLNKIIKVRFKDNGHIHKPITKSLGLMGIEERTLGIDGKLIINTENGFETIMLLKR